MADSVDADHFPRSTAESSYLGLPGMPLEPAVRLSLAACLSATRSLSAELVKSTASDSSLPPVPLRRGLTKL